MTDRLSPPERLEEIPLTADEWEYIGRKVEQWRVGARNSGNPFHADRLGEAWRLIVNYIDANKENLA